MATTFAAVLVPLLSPQAPPSTPDVLDPGIVLVAPGVSAERGFRLGDGGVHAADAALAALPGGKGECTTPGGVVVQCRAEGTKLTFPSGRELLCAPDGFLHLRDGAVAGPFVGGVELRLLDGSCLRIDRGGARRTPISDVFVVAGDVAVQLWRRNEPLHQRGTSEWAGERLFCLGDGGSLYRALALGPVVTLQRVLAPGAGPQLPNVRVALQVEPLLLSLRLLADSRARHTAPEIVTEVQLLLANAAQVFPGDGPPPPRTGSDPLQFLLRAGYDLRFRVDGGDVRLQLARHQEPAFLEWQLGYGAAVRCVEASLQPSGLVQMPAVAPELQPRLQRHELVLAVRVLEQLRRGVR